MSLATGEHRRDLALAGHEMSKAQWIKMARAVAEAIAREKGQVTSDDVRDRCDVPAGMNPSVMGAVLRCRTFKLLHFEKSRRDVANARRIGVYRLA